MMGASLSPLLLPCDLLQEFPSEDTTVKFQQSVKLKKVSNAPDSECLYNSPRYWISYHSPYI